MGNCPVAEIWERVKNNTSDDTDTEQRLFTYMEDTGGACTSPEGDVYDLIVEVNGISNVTFDWKPSTDTRFDSYMFTTDLPTMAMNFSASRRCIVGFRGYMQLRMFDWGVIEN